MKKRDRVEWSQNEPPLESSKFQVGFPFIKIDVIGLGLVVRYVNSKVT